MPRRRRPDAADEDRTHGSGSAAVRAPDLAGISDEASFTSALAQSSAAARAEAMRSLSAGAGNAAAARMISRNADPHVCGPGCGHQRLGTSSADGSAAPVPTAATETSSGSIVKSAPFSVRIRMGPTHIPPTPRPATSTLDSAEQEEPTRPEEVPGVEEDPLAAVGERPGRAAAAEGESAAKEADPAPGKAGEPEKVKIAEIRKPELEQVHCCDPIEGLMMYEANIIRGTHVPATAFGICRFGDVRLKEVSITKMDLTGSFLVLGIVENRIKWEVHSLGRTNIASANDPNIKQGKYQDVVRDLTPNMSSSGGRPPRLKYWARDLTERHELFHAHDVEGQGQGATSAAVTWLEAQSVATMAGARALVNQMPNRIVQTLAAGMGEPAEVRAYGDGAPVYRERAETIQVTGDAELYDP